MWSYRGEKTNLSPGVFSLNIWMLPLHLFLISPLFVNDALLDSNVLKKQNMNGETSVFTTSWQMCT